MRRNTSLLAVALLACPACTFEEDDETSLRMMPDTSSNSGGGIVFNTSEMDDLNFAELTPTVTAADPAKPKPQAPTMAGFYLTSLTLETGTALQGFKAPDGEIIGIGAVGSEHPGNKLLNSWWGIKHESRSEPYFMKLAQIVESTDGVPRYRFTRTTCKTTAPVCPVGPNGVAGVARVLSGFSLDEYTGKIKNAPATTYFACDTGATGKAADLGYYDIINPSPNPGPNPEYDAEWDPFETAIRVIRADYCYDGKSHTTPNTAVIIEDNLDVIPPKTQKPGTRLEAVWGRDRLICAGEGRKAPIHCEDKDIPACEGERLSDYTSDALFITRLPPEIEVVELPFPPGGVIPPGPKPPEDSLDPVLPQ